MSYVPPPWPFWRTGSRDGESPTCIYSGFQVVRRCETQDEAERVVRAHNEYVSSIVTATSADLDDDSEGVMARQERRDEELRQEEGR